MEPEFEIEYRGKSALLHCPGFDAGMTLDCGQAFRWKCDENRLWQGVARGRRLTLSQDKDTVILYDTDRELFENFWYAYFDLGRDYGELKRAYGQDSSLRVATEECGGIRIIRQESWEALCSFIISQNNNIPRIKGIVERLCMLLGDDLGDGFFSFPSAEKIASAGVEALAPIRSGFRAKYIFDAACKVASGEIDFDVISRMPLTEAENELKKIKGVGPKVAQCALLYGLGRADAFPVDVWVKRILAELYPNGMPECTEGTRGIAQQFLFHWRRTVAEHNN